MLLSLLPVLRISFMLTQWSRAIFLCDKGLFAADELNLGDRSATRRPNYATCHDAFIGYARQRHDLISCRETRPVGAQSVHALRTLLLQYTHSELEFCSVAFTSVLLL